MVTTRAHATLVTTVRDLAVDGVQRSDVLRELADGRWQRAGLAIVQHNGPLSPAQRRRVARIHAGPRSVLTAFTAVEVLGVRGWERNEVHVLAPSGTRLRRGSPVPIVLHVHHMPARTVPGGGVELLRDATVRASGTFASPRPACGLPAAVVQQLRADADALRDAVQRATRVRHRAARLAALADISGGSEALSEIDFLRLCRRHGLPDPIRQAVRRDTTGRRRYLDATWRRADGRLVVVEVDGALHLQVRRWWDDQLRQNELALADAVVLRFPSVIVRTDERTVVDQLRRALLR